MVLCTLINISLDISANISWWILKNTLYGTYYIISYIRPPNKTKEEIELMELRNEISQLNKQLHFINIIQNNPNIITRNQLMLTNTEHINDIDITLLDDEFIFINDETRTTDKLN
jgi:hypothetical protein